MSETINNRSITKKITAIKLKGKRNWDKEITNKDGNKSKQSKEKGKMLIKNMPKIEETKKEKKGKKGKEKR